MKHVATNFLHQPRNVSELMCVLDTINRACAQIKQRFLSPDLLISTFNVLLPLTLLHISDNCMQQQNCQLNRMIPTSHLLFQLSCCHFTQALFDVVNQFNHLRIAQLLLVGYHTLSFTYSDICIVYMLLTLPVTVATCKQSSSKLKPIKIYLQSTMSEERLRNLAMLSTQN